MFAVKFAKDEKNIKESVWQIIDKADGKVIVSATLNDITEGRDIDDGALNEMQTKGFGEVILEEIADNGVVATAKTMLGSKFEKIAAMDLKGLGSEDEEEAKENALDIPGEDAADEFGMHETTDKLEKDIHKADEDEDELAADELLLDTDKAKKGVLPSEKPAELGEEEMEAFASKYFMYRGIVAELKPMLSKFAADTKVTDIDKVIVRAEKKLDAVKAMLDGVPGDLPVAMNMAVEAVGSVSNLSDLIEKAKGLAQDNPELLEILDEIAEQAVVSDEEDFEAQDVEDASEDKEEADEDKEEAEEEKEEADEDKEEADEEAEDKEDEEEPMKSKEKKKENPFAKKEEKKDSKDDGKKIESKLADKMRKLAKEKGEKGDYDVTPKANFEKEYHSGDKGKLKEEGDHFHNIWEIAKELESLGGKKATGKMAKIISDMTKFAEEKGVDPKVYFNNILGDSKYVNEYLSEKTPDSVIKEWSTATKDTANAYAAIVTKVKTAYRTALEMQNKDILKKTAADLDSQIDRFMAMDESTFNAYVDSLEAISPTAELEDGRFKVAILDKPENGFVVKGFVDGVPVCNLSGDELGTNGGRITKAALKHAIGIVKQGLNNGFFDSVLSDGSIEADNVGESSLGGLNLGIENVKVRGLKDLLS